MDAWSYVSEAKGFGCDESISAQDMNGSMVLPGEKGIEIQGFEELGLPEMMRKPWDVINSFPGVSNSEVVSKRMYTPITSAMNAYSGDESSSKFSNSVVESNSRDSSLIDLNLGRFADHRDTQNLNSSKIAPILSSVESFIPAKRIRARLSSQAPFCQVHGCKKDLSSSKNYHKRHKVCEVHSKTAKVIVDGIEQRFCQQCSRFHLLGEFDDGKRSCRKRLAGHNERRRKPQAGTYSGRTGRLFHSYIGSTGSRLQGSMLTNSSFICQDILPTDLLPPLKYDTNDWSMHRKLEEDGTNCHPESEITIKNGYFHPKSVSSHSFVRSIPPLHINEVNSSSGRNLNDTTNQNFHEAFILFDSASSVQDLSGISASGRALSLLSSQSHNSSSHSMGILIPQASIHGLSNKFDPTGLISAVDNNFGPILSSDENGVVNYGDEIFHGSQYLNRKGRLSCDEGATIDLLQLSSQLQRVEHERESMEMKCGHKIT